MPTLTEAQARQAVERYLEQAGLQRNWGGRRAYEIAKRRLRRRLPAAGWPLTIEETWRIVADYVGLSGGGAVRGEESA